MTGTAMTEANEFWKIYKLDVIAIPTNKPLDPRQPPRPRSTAPSKEKWNAIVDEIVEVHETGRPILVGTDRRREDREAAPSMLKRARHQARGAQRQAGPRGPRGRDRRPGRPASAP